MYSVIRSVYQLLLRSHKIFAAYLSQKHDQSNDIYSEFYNWVENWCKISFTINLRHSINIYPIFTVLIYMVEPYNFTSSLVNGAGRQPV